MQRIPKSPIRAVLWDYGNVIVDWSPRHLYSRIINDPKRLEYFLETICPLSWHLQHDKGVPMSETIPTRQKLYPEFAVEIGLWQNRFGDMILGLISGSGEIVHTLYKAKIPQYILSNMPTEMVDVAFNPYGLRPFFADMIISGNEKLIKPDLEIYKCALKRMGGISASEVFFIDDSAANIDAAKGLGFVTHLFKNANDLQDAMIEAGLPL
jgi:FMN phosphatase YigB (HAD superfamily)